MTDDKSLVPKLRFPGFSGAWEQRKVGDLLVEYSEYVTGFKYPIVTSSRRGLFLQEDYFDGGRSDTNANVTFRVVPEDFVTYRHMSDDSVFHFNKNTFSTPVAVSREYPVFTSVKTVNIDFVVQYLNSSVRFLYFSEAQKMGGTRTRLYFKTLEQFRLLIPNKVEQDAIVSFFKQLDDLIALHRRKLSHLEKLKNGLLQKMFPKSGESYPELRFPGFANTWEQRKLGDVGKARSGVGFPESEQGGQEGVPFFKVSDLNNVGNEYEMKNSNNYVSYVQIQHQKWKPINEVPAIVFAKVGAAIMLDRKRIVRLPFLLDNNTMAYIFDSSWDPDFGKALFETIRLPKYIQAGALPSYNGSDIEDIVIRIPNTAEQRQIGSFFKRLDDLIALHQRKLSHLQQQKKALLQQMFV